MYHMYWTAIVVALIRMRSVYKSCTVPRTDAPMIPPFMLILSSYRLLLQTSIPKLSFLCKYLDSPSDCSISQTGREPAFGARQKGLWHCQSLISEKKDMTAMDGRMLPPA